MYGYIYLVINLFNNKVYVGQTTSLNPLSYINKHFQKAFCKHKDYVNKYLYNAIRKYGKQNFKYKILGECYSREELNEAEIECIYFYRSFGVDGETFDTVYGYNMTKGGEGGDVCCSEESKLRKHNSYVKYWSKVESKKKISSIIKEIHNRPEIKKSKSLKMSGEKNPSYRHDIDKDIIKIINKLNSGYSLTKLAKELACTKKTIKIKIKKYYFGNKKNI